MPERYGPKSVEMILALKRLRFVLCIQWPKTRLLSRLLNDAVIEIVEHPHVRRGDMPAYAYRLSAKGEEVAARLGPRGEGHPRLKKGTGA